MLKFTVAFVLASASICAIAAAAADAGPYGWGGDIDARQDRQKKQILAGIDQGLLTRREVQILRTEQSDIEELERCLKQFGGHGLQAYERRVLQRRLTIANNNIAKLKNNSERRRYSAYDNSRGNGHN